jgi:Cd2+/Zn2+-exporting ATPase
MGREVGVEEVTLDEVVLVRPGERVPVDGVIGAGASAINQAPVTGERVPVEKASGDNVFARTVNGDGSLEIRVTRLAKDNPLARVMRLVAEAQGQKTRTPQLTERFTRGCIPAVLIVVLLVVVVPLALGVPCGDACLRAMTLLVASSPCALALGTPSAMLAGIAQAARRGVLINGGVHLETLGHVQTVAFDTTGTLTHGRPEVTEVVTADAARIDASLWLTRAAAVEKRSGHPLAQAVVCAAEARSLGLPEAGELTSFTGRGARSTVNGEVVPIGKRPEGTQGCLLLPKRWGVERTFAWVARSRRFSKDAEYLAHTSDALIQVAMIQRPVRRLAHITCSGTPSNCMSFG